MGRRGRPNIAADLTRLPPRAPPPPPPPPPPLPSEKIMVPDVPHALRLQAVLVGEPQGEGMRDGRAGQCATAAGARAHAHPPPSRPCPPLAGPGGLVIIHSRQSVYLMGEGEAGMGWEGSLPTDRFGAIPLTVPRVPTGPDPPRPAHPTTPIFRSDTEDAKDAFRRFLALSAAPGRMLASGAAVAK